MLFFLGISCVSIYKTKKRGNPRSPLPPSHAPATMYSNNNTILTLPSPRQGSTSCTYNLKNLAQKDSFQDGWHYMTPTSRSCMSLHQTHPLHAQWRELGSPAKATTPRPVSHYTPPSIWTVSTLSQHPQQHNSHGYTIPRVFLNNPLSSTHPHYLSTPQRRI